MGLCKEHDLRLDVAALTCNQIEAASVKKSSTFSGVVSTATGEDAVKPNERTCILSQDTTAITLMMTATTPARRAMKWILLQGTRTTWTSASTERSPRQRSEKWPRNSSCAKNRGTWNLWKLLNESCKTMTKIKTSKTFA